MKGDLETEKVSIDSVRPHPKNVRQGDIGAICESLQAHGQYRAIVAQRSTGHILAGNHTWKAAKQLGWSDITAHFIDCDDDQAMRILLADNRANDLASYDDAALAALLQELSVTDEGLAGTLFDGDALDQLIDDIGREIEQDEIPEHAPAITQLGDIWLLGQHRLMCGDSTNSDDVSKLLNGQIAQMCFTSPPYGLGDSVKLSGNKVMSSKNAPYLTHSDDANQWSNLMSDWYAASLSAVSDVWIVNVQMLAHNKRLLMEWLNDRKQELIDIITWDKGHGTPAMQEGVLNSAFEWLVILGLDQPSKRIPFASWRGTINNVYRAPAQRHNEYSSVHAATMPSHLPMWVFSELCPKVKSVFDPFGGTGTTLICAEQAGRICYTMELDQHYCDIICARYEKQTGNKPRLEATGEEHTFLS